MQSRERRVLIRSVHFFFLFKRGTATGEEYSNGMYVEIEWIARFFFCEPLYILVLYELRVILCWFRFLSLLQFVSRHALAFIQFYSENKSADSEAQSVVVSFQLSTDRSINLRDQYTRVSNWRYANWCRVMPVYRYRLALAIRGMNPTRDKTVINGDAVGTSARCDTRRRSER